MRKILAKTFNFSELLITGDLDLVSQVPELRGHLGFIVFIGTELTVPSLVACMRASEFDETAGIMMMMIIIIIIIIIIVAMVIMNVTRWHVILYEVPGSMSRETSIPSSARILW